MIACAYSLLSECVKWAVRGGGGTRYHLRSAPFSPISLNTFIFALRNLKSSTNIDSCTVVLDLEGAMIINVIYPKSEDAELIPCGKLLGSRLFAIDPKLEAALHSGVKICLLFIQQTVGECGSTAYLFKIQTNWCKPAKIQWTIPTLAASWSKFSNWGAW